MNFTLQGAYIPAASGPYMVTMEELRSAVAAQYMDTIFYMVVAALGVNLILLLFREKLPILAQDYMIGTAAILNLASALYLMVIR